MSIIRKRSAPHKAYIPSNARDNHYILVEFAISDALIDKFISAQAKAANQFGEFYHQLSQQLFKLTDQYEIKNCLFIANDKLARVRYSQEMHQWQTNQQILFYYNPASHELKKAFYDVDKRANKISLLFLSSGNDLRVNAASFHSHILLLINQFITDIDVTDIRLRIRDHQHLTYDLFAGEKGNKDTNAQKLRDVTTRYASQYVTLPEDISAMTHAIVTLPISNSLISKAEFDPNAKDPYNPLYSMVTDAFTDACKRYNLNNGALIANGLVPIVRYSLNETIARIGELQMLGYNPEESPCGIISKWDAHNLVDSIQLIFVATKENKTDYGYGRFLNHIEKAVKAMANTLELSPIQEEITVRFHQHIAYYK